MPSDAPASPINAESSSISESDEPTANRFEVLEFLFRRLVVVVFPADPDRWVGTGLWSPRLASTAVQNNGAYRLEMPAGEYLVAAVARTHTRTWRDPAFLRRLERQASRVTLAWGQTVTRDLTLTEIK